MFEPSLVLPRLSIWSPSCLLSFQHVSTNSSGHWYFRGSKQQSRLQAMSLSWSRAGARRAPFGTGRKPFKMQGTGSSSVKTPSLLEKSERARECSCRHVCRLADMSCQLKNCFLVLAVVGVCESCGGSVAQRSTSGTDWKDILDPPKYLELNGT